MTSPRKRNTYGNIPPMEKILAIKDSGLVKKCFFRSFWCKMSNLSTSCGKTKNHSWNMNESAVPLANEIALTSFLQCKPGLPPIRI